MPRKIGFTLAGVVLDSATGNSMYCPDAVGGMVDYMITKDRTW